MTTSNDFTNKTTLVGKLLKYFLPLLIIPIVAIAVFYDTYIKALVTKDTIDSFESKITRISNSPDIQQYTINSDDATLANVSIVDANTKTINSSRFYNKYIKQYIESFSVDNENQIYHNEVDKFMMKPILKEGKIKSFVVIDYKNEIDKKLATVDQTFIFIIFIVAFILFISIVFTIIFALQITNPIRELIDGIKIISDGNKSYRIDISTDDEISVLANSFNEMIDKIDKNQLDIERLNSNLANKIEEEVEKNRKKDQILFQQSRLAQMGEMIGMIAHQWRQPLAAIGSTNASLELKATLDKLDNEIVIKHAKSISQYTQHLSSTIDDFRSFFKPDKIKKETSLEDVVSVSLNIIETSIANKNISIIKELNSKERFKTYPNELKQVVLNLLKNAEEILIERSIENPTIKIIANHNSLIISDNGGGVPEDIIDKIFDPYFSTKLSKNGTGLGLYMSKTIVDEHCGAKLSVANDKDGASFSILL